MTGQRKRLAELILRSANAKASVEFYRDVIGLEIYATLGSATFLKIDDEHEGHPQLLGIFDKSHEFSGPKDVQTDEAEANVGTLHHFAFFLEQEDFPLERDRLKSLGVDLIFSDFAQFGWRSMFMHDPDGNSVELVCYDASILDKEANQRARDIVDSE